MTISLYINLFCNLIFKILFCFNDSLHPVGIRRIFTNPILSHIKYIAINRQHETKKKRKPYQRI